MLIVNKIVSCESTGNPVHPTIRVLSYKVKGPFSTWILGCSFEMILKKLTKEKTSIGEATVPILKTSSGAVLKASSPWSLYKSSNLSNPVACSRSVGTAPAFDPVPIFKIYKSIQFHQGFFEPREVIISHLFGIKGR